MSPIGCLLTAARTTPAIAIGFSSGAVVAAVVAAAESGAGAGAATLASFGGDGVDGVDSGWGASSVKCWTYSIAQGPGLPSNSAGVNVNCFAASTAASSRSGEPD